MKITDNSIINVYNTSNYTVVLPTHLNPEGYLFAGYMDDNPVMIPITFSEIRLINSSSMLFREKHLTFDEKDESDIYEALKILGWKDILTNDQIEDLILNPTKEKLEKVVAATTMSMLDRIRGALVSMQNTGQYDISQRVIDVVNARYQELYAGKRGSQIVINKTQQEVVEETKKDVIQEELAKMRKEIESQVRKEMAESNKASAKKPAGRPPKTAV